MTAPGSRGALSQEASDAVLAHYLSRPDVIRQRAQHAAAIAGATAAALVAAGGIAELYRYPKPIEVLLVGAILAWMATVGVYMHVVARYVVPVSPLDENGAVRPDREILDAAIRNAGDVRSSLNRAQWVGRGALTLTAVAIAVAAWHAEALDDSVLSRMVVSDELATAVGTVCGPDSALRNDARNFRAEVRLDDLEATFIKIQVRDARCRPRDEQVKMRVPTEGILAAAPVED